MTKIKFVKVPKDWDWIPDNTSKNMKEKDLKGLTPEERVSKMVHVAKEKIGQRWEKKEKELLFRQKYWENKS